MEVSCTLTEREQEYLLIILLHTFAHSVFSNFDNTTGQEKNEMKDNLDCTGHDMRTLNVLKHFDELKVFIEAETPHIFGINQTKLDDTVTDEELRIENYHDIIRKDRKRHGGGVAFYVHKSISFSKLTLLRRGYLSSIN